MRNLVVLMLSLFIALYAHKAFASKTVTIHAHGEYVMGAGETMEVAEERARKAAMQSAAEQAGAFLKSYTKTLNFALEEDVVEVIANHSMKVEVLERKKTAVGNLDAIRFYIKIRAIMNEEEIEANLKRIRNDQAALDAYNRLKAEYEKQNRELEALKNRLARADEAEKQKISRMISDEEKKFKANLWLEKAARMTRVDYDERMKAYQKALELDPNLAGAYVGRARAMYHIANDLYPSVVDGETLSKTEEKANKLREALSDIEKAVNLDDSYGDAYAARAEVLTELRKSERALSRVKGIEDGFLTAKLKYDRQILEDLNRAIILIGAKHPELYMKRASFYLGAAQDAASADPAPDVAERQFGYAVTDIDRAVALCKQDVDCLIRGYDIKGRIYTEQRFFYLRNGNKGKEAEAAALAQRWHNEARRLEQEGQKNALKREEQVVASFEKTEFGRLDHELQDGWRERALGLRLTGKHPEKSYEQAVGKMKKRITGGTASAWDYLFMAFHDTDNLERYFEKGVSLLEKKNPRGMEAMLLVNFYLDAEFYRDRGKEDITLHHLNKARAVVDTYLPQAQRIVKLSDLRRIRDSHASKDNESFLKAVSGLSREAAEAFYWIQFAERISKTRAEIYERMGLPSKAREEYRFLCEILDHPASCKDVERLK